MKKIEFNTLNQTVKRTFGNGCGGQLPKCLPRWLKNMYEWLVWLFTSWVHGECRRHDFEYSRGGLPWHRWHGDWHLWLQLNRNFRHEWQQLYLLIKHVTFEFDAPPFKKMLVRELFFQVSRTAIATVIWPVFFIIVFSVGSLFFTYGEFKQLAEILAVDTAQKAGVKVNRVSDYWWLRLFDFIFSNTLLIILIGCCLSMLR